MTLRDKPDDAAAYDVDIGENVFHVVGLDAAGRLAEKAKFRQRYSAATL